MKVGIQMYSVKDMIAQDPRSAFEAVAKEGYKYWEICQLYDRKDLAFNYGLQMSPQEARELLSELGVKVIGSHLTREQIESREYLEACFSYLQQIGSLGVGLGSSMFQYNDLNALKKQCESWNEVGRMARDYGLQFYYHNHFQEFQRFSGQRVFDLLMDCTNPEWVSFELDTFWALRGGADPVQLLEDYKGRILYLHQKDFAKNFRSPLNLYSYLIDENAPVTRESFRMINEPDAFVEVGTGCLDIQSIIDAGNKAGVKYIILEQDRTTLGELESIRISMDRFRQYRGIAF